jgi:hypothetical protein
MTSATAEMLKKKGPKAKAKQTVEGVVAEGIAQTTLALLAESITSMDEEQAKETLTNLLENEGLNDFRLGGILARYQSNQDWWGDYGTFKEYVTGELNLHYRKVMYLIEIYNVLVKHGIEWDIVKTIGWTKLQVICKVIDADNVKDWVSKAEVMTTIQLQAAVKAHKEGDGEEGPAPNTDVTTMTFKVHPDQKDQIRMALDKAKEELNTDFDTVALEGICTGYLTGSVAPPAEGEQAELVVVPFTELVASKTPEEVLQAFGAVWPEIDIVVTSEV